LLGGSKDSAMNKLTKDVLEWSIPDGTVQYGEPMLYRQTDFATLCTYNSSIRAGRPFIYCVGGCRSFFDITSRPSNSRLDLISNKWEPLPTIDETTDFHTSNYQNVSLTLAGRARYLCAFWLSQQPGHLTYAVLDTHKNQKW